MILDAFFFILKALYIERRNKMNNSRRKQKYDHDDYVDDILRNELSYLDDVYRYHVDSPKPIEFLNKIITAAIPISLVVGLGMIIVDGIRTKLKK